MICSLIILDLHLVVGIGNENSEVVFVIEDLNLQSEKSLVARDLHCEFDLLGSKRNPSLQDLVDILVELRLLFFVIDVEALVEIEPE